MINNKYVKDLITLSKAEQINEHIKWAKEIPFIKWPADWLVKAIPPYAGAVIRYKVKNSHGEEVSIYLDCYDRLGFWGSPYWESYPGAGADGDPFRCDMKDTKLLLKAISAVGKKKIKRAVKKKARKRKP